MLRDAPCFAASCESGNLWSARSTLFTKSADDESLKSNSAVCVGKARVRNSMGNASCPAGTGVCVVKTHLLRTFSISSPLKDRKSTRLNSSHLVISYAVFCLKKKKQ